MGKTCQKQSDETFDQPKLWHKRNGEEYVMFCKFPKSQEIDLNQIVKQYNTEPTVFDLKMMRKGNKKLMSIQDAVIGYLAATVETDPDFDEQFLDSAREAGNVVNRLLHERYEELLTDYRQRARQEDFSFRFFNHVRETELSKMTDAELDRLESTVYSSLGERWAQGNEYLGLRRLEGAIARINRERLDEESEQRKKIRDILEVGNP